MPFETGTWIRGGFLLLSRWYRAGAPYAPNQSPGRNTNSWSVYGCRNHLRCFRRADMNIQNIIWQFFYTHTEKIERAVYLKCVFKAHDATCGSSGSSVCGGLGWEVEGSWLKLWLRTKVGSCARTPLQLCRGSPQQGTEPKPRNEPLYPPQWPRKENRGHFHLNQMNLHGCTFVLSGPRGCLKTIRRGAFASSRVTLFNLFTKRSGRGVTTGLGASLQQKKIILQSFPIVRRKGSDPVSKSLHWLLGSVPDSAYIAGTKFPCALVEDDCELHLITRLELQTILHLFYVEEQFFAFTNFICDETKLQRGKTNSEKRHFNLTLNFVACDKICTRPVNKGYLIFDTLDQGSALRHHNTCHLLPSLRNCANLELYRFSFLKTICLVSHTHNPKGYFLAFTCPWNKEGRVVDILFGRAVNVNILPLIFKHKPSSTTSISPWYSDWEGSTLRKGRITFPVITVASISSPRAFTSSRKSRVVKISIFSNTHQGQYGVNESLLTWSHFGNLFSTDFVSFPLRRRILHSVSQF